MSPSSYHDNKEDVLSSMVVVCMAIMGSTNCFLTECKARSKGGSPGLVLSTWLRTTGQGGHGIQRRISYCYFAQ